MPYKNKEKKVENDKLWRKTNPKKVKQSNSEYSQKSGKHYKKTLKYNRAGLRRERRRIRSRDGNRWRKYKQIIAPDSQIHHEWIPGTANYNGIALVDTQKHQQGIINPIQILEGKITLMMQNG